MSVRSQIYSFAAAAFAVTALCAPAKADVQIGTLNCRGGGVASFVVGSVTNLECVFTGNGGSYNYAAQIRRLGLDLGAVDRTQLTWVVLAPSLRFGADGLAGVYAGVSAGVTIGIGGNFNALVGGLGNSFTLQPLSAQAQTGLNVEGTVASMELQPIAEQPQRRWRKKHRRHRR